MKHFLVTLCFCSITLLPLSAQAPLKWPELQATYGFTLPKGASFSKEILSDMYVPVRKEGLYYMANYSGKILSKKGFVAIHPVATGPFYFAKAKGETDFFLYTYPDTRVIKEAFSKEEVAQSRNFPLVMPLYSANWEGFYTCTKDTLYNTADWKLEGVGYYAVPNKTTVKKTYYISTDSKPETATWQIASGAMGIRSTNFVEVRNQKGLYNLQNRAGKIMLDTWYDHIKILSSNAFVATKGEKKAVGCLETLQLGAFQYEDVQGWSLCPNYVRARKGDTVQLVNVVRLETIPTNCTVECLCEEKIFFTYCEKGLVVDFATSDTLYAADKQGYKNIPSACVDGQAVMQSNDQQYFSLKDSALVKAPIQKDFFVMPYENIKNQLKKGEISFPDGFDKSKLYTHSIAASPWVSVTDYQFYGLIDTVGRWFIPLSRNKMIVNNGISLFLEKQTIEFNTRKELLSSSTPIFDISDFQLTKIPKSFSVSPSLIKISRVMNYYLLEQMEANGGLGSALFLFDDNKQFVGAFQGKLVPDKLQELFQGTAFEYQIQHREVPHLHPFLTMYDEQGYYYVRLSDGKVYVE